MPSNCCKYLKTSVILVMVLGIFNIATVNWIIYHQQHMALKRNFERLLKAGIPDDQLVVFRMSPDEEKEMRWVNHKEFIFHEEYYDVVSMSFESGEKVIRCISDKAEHEIEELAEEMAGRSEKNGSQKFPLLKYVPGNSLIAVKSQFPFLIHRTCLIHQMKDHFQFQIHPQPPDLL